MQKGQSLQSEQHASIPSTPEKSRLEIDGPKGKSQVKTTAQKIEEHD